MREFVGVLLTMMVFVVDCGRSWEQAHTREQIRRTISETQMTPPATTSTTTQPTLTGLASPAISVGIPARADRLSLVEAATHYGVKYETIRRWINIGVNGIKLKSIRVGGRVFVTLAAIRAFDAALNKYDEQVERAARGYVDKKTQQAVSDGLKALGVIQ